MSIDIPWDTPFEPEKYYYLFTNKGEVIRILNYLDNESTLLKNIKYQLLTAINGILYDCEMLAGSAHLNDITDKEVAFRDFLSSDYIGQLFAGTLTILGDGLCQAFYEWEKYKRQLRIEFVTDANKDNPRFRTEKEFLSFEYKIIENRIKKHSLPNNIDFIYFIHINNKRQEVKLKRFYDLVDNYYKMASALHNGIVYMYIWKSPLSEDYFFKEDKDYDLLKNHFFTFLTDHFKLAYLEDLINGNEPAPVKKDNPSICEHIHILNTEKRLEIVTLLYKQLFDAGYISVSFDSFKLHFENSSDVSEKIRWLKDETELAHLFDYLQTKRIITNKKKFILVEQHFINKDGKNFDHKQLGVSKSKANQIDAYPFIDLLTHSIYNLVSSK